MTNTLKYALTAFIFGSLIFNANSTQAQDKAAELLGKMSKAVGSWDKMYKQKDVEFNYTYEYTDTKQKDVSVERYIFEGEHSWGKYTTHEINVLPKGEGVAIQSYVNNKPAVSLAGKKLDDKEAIGMSHFLRKANYYWFTMFFKLNDPGTSHKYLGTENVNGIAYEKVEISFDGNKTGKEQNDMYVLYINPTTHLVDRFFFSLPALGINKPVLLMEVEYAKIKGLQIPAVRKIYRPNNEGKYAKEAWLIETSTDIKFKNGFTAADLGIELVLSRRAPLLINYARLLSTTLSQQRLPL